LTQSKSELGLFNPKKNFKMIGVQKLEPTVKHMDHLSHMYKTNLNFMPEVRKEIYKHDSSKYKNIYEEHKVRNLKEIDI